MAGYSRQSTADIVANAVIKAAPVNAEYNALRDTFALATGHKHDGSSTEGGYVPLIADADALNKVVVDTTNNRISFFSEVGGSAVEQVRIQDGAIVPVTDDDIDIGTSALKFKDLYIDGVGYIDSVTVTGAATFSNIDVNGGAIDGVTIGAASAGAGTFTDLTATGTTTVTTADINGGNIDGTIIGASTAAAGTFTALTASGTTTVTTADINGGNIDGTVIGASSAAAGSFTTVSTSGQATLATVDINGGNIDGTIIGASSAAAITGTTITASSGFVGNLAGNITGDIDGDITGNITGDVTGNVTAGSGTSTFNNVTVNGTLDVTGTTIANVTDPSNAQDAATKNYVDTEVSALVDSAPGTLNTLNELAAALGDDASFSTTITNSIAAKLPLAGGTMSGAIAMGTAKITGLGDPTANQDAATKKYTTDTFLPLAGGTLTGAVAAGSNKITATYTPSANADLTTKTYVDSIAGSGTAAASSATAAASSATAAASSATGAANSATAAASSATSAAASFDSFDDRYLGAKSSAPSVDNDGDALQVGTLYFNTTSNSMQVYGGSGFTAAGSSVNGTTDRNTYTATSGQTSFSATYDAGFVDVYLNGVKLLLGTDFTATSGTAVVLASGATAGDIVDIVAYGTFTLSTHYTKTETDARYLLESNNLSDLTSAATALTNLGVTSTAAELNILDGVTATATELNYVDGVTSAIQTQVDAKQPYATIAVTVVNSGGNKYALDGTVQQLGLLAPSITYRFDQSDSSNSGHPLLLSTTSDGTHGGGSAFSTGVTAVGTPGSAGAYTQVKLEQDAPDTLYYYCTNHSGMGGEIDSKATVSSLSDLSVTATASELNIMDGVTATTAEINYVDGVTSAIQTQIDTKAAIAGPTFTGTLAAPTINASTALQIGGVAVSSTAAELNILDGVTSTAAELNILDGVTSTAAELNILDGVTSTATELNILDGVTATTTELNYNDITTLGTSQASKAVTADANGDVTLSEELKAKSYNETYVSLSAASSVTIDCETGNVFALSTGQNTTFVFSNPPASGTAYGFTLKLTAGGSHSITYPNTVDFAGGTAPDAPASGETDVLVFFTVDGGTNWYGAIAIDAAG